MALQPGSILDQRYRLLEELGRGGMGVVWKAQDLTLERVVAIKILRREMLDQQSQERLRREARSAASLTHPHIVTIYDVVLGPDSSYLVMQHVAGESLRTWQDRMDLSWLDLTEVALQLTSALAYSHAAGILHRDLKPENVMVAPRRARTGEKKERDPSAFPYEVTLLDFGLAKPFDASRLTQSGTFVGTASYMSPEQITGGTVDGRSDIYSLGVILYELVAKRRPFEGDNFQNILYRHMNERPRVLSQLNPGVDPELEQVVMRCLEKAPERRWEGADELHQALVRIHRGMTEKPAELVASSLATAPSIPERTPESVFVGRGQELRDLRLRYQMAQMGEAQLVLLAGEAGAGKSRLVAELCRQSLDSGAQVLRGRFFEQSRSFPYQGFIELLEEHLRTLKERRKGAGKETSLQDFQELSPDLARISPFLGELLGMGSVQEPERADRGLIFETFARVFIRMALRQPLLVVLEDLHWADMSVELLSFLYRRTGSFRIMYVGTYRPEALSEGHPIGKLVASATQERSFATLPVKPLSLEDTQALVGSFLPREDGLPRLARKIHDITEGNPFFVIEMMKSLLEKMAGRSQGGRNLTSQVLRISGEAALPSSVRDVVMERVSRLAEDLKEVLLRASVVGRSFEFETLMALGETPEEELMRALEKLIGAGLLQEEPRAGGERFLFSSAVVREALYRGISGRRKRLMHEKVAASLEGGGVLGDPASVFALAHHYVQAGTADKAITYSIRAAELARQQAALDDAEGFYLTAKDFLDDEDPAMAAPRSLAVVRALGEVYRERGELAKATLTLKEALTRLEEGGRKKEAAELCLDLGRVYAEARHPAKAKELVLRGIGLLGEDEPSETLHGLFRLKADIASLEGEHAVAENVHRKAERVARGLKASKQFKQGGEIRIGCRARLRAMDPHLAAVQFDAGVLGLLWEPLVCYGYGTDLVPRLLERWDISADGQTYHLHVKEGVRFHDGQPLDAEDVMLSFLRAMKPNLGGEGYRLLEPIVGAKEFRQGRADGIEGIRILDHATVEIALLQPVPFFLSMLTSVNVAILPKSMWDEPEILPVGTGPFLTDAYEPGKRLVLKRNPYYHRPGFPNVEKVTMELGLPPDERVARFLEGKSDLLMDPLPEELRALHAGRAAVRLVRREVTSLATNYLLVQKRIAPFNDARVRQALAACIDRQALQAAWERGLAIAATTLLPPDLLGYEQRDRLQRPRLEEARTLLKQAGYAGGFETELAVRRSSSLYRTELLAELKRQLAAIDIVLQVNALPDEEYAETIAEGDAALVLQGWVADYPDPDAFFHALFISSVGRARAFLSSPALDGLIERGRSEQGREERRTLYSKAEDFIRNEAVFIPLSHDREVVHFHPHVRGVSLRLMAPHVEIDRLWVAEPSS